MVRIGVIGVGGMGSFHAHTLAALAGVEVVAVADPSESNRNAVADALGCTAIAEPIELARRDDIDGMVIASPDHTHPDLAIAAMEAGAMVLCEKPLAATQADALRVIEAELSGGRRRIQMGFMREYDLAHTQLRERIGGIGTIDYARFIHRNANRERRPLDQIVVQSMVHEAHSVRFLLGDEVTEVTAFGSGAERGSYRHVLARAALAGGGHATLEFDDGGFAYEVAVEVLGRDADALTGPPIRAVSRRGGSIDVHLGTDWFGWFADAYRVQDEAWVASISNGVAGGPSTWDGYVAQVIVDAVMTSLLESRTVAVSPGPRPSLYD